MIDIEEKDLLDIMFELTHIKDEEGNDVPNFCFATDMSVDLDMSEEEVAKAALENGYSAFRVFPGETSVGGIIIVADGATTEPVESMYDDFYGEVPEISELRLDDDGNIIEVDDIKESEDLELEIIPDITDDEKYGTEQECKDFEAEFIDKARSLGADLVFNTKVGPKRTDSIWYQGDVATITYKDYVIDVVSDNGDIDILFDDGERVTDLDMLERERGVYNDETWDNSYSNYEGPGFVFYIRKEGGPTLDGWSDLDFDTDWDIGSALNVPFYINEVIPEYDARVEDDALESSDADGAPVDFDSMRNDQYNESYKRKKPKEKKVGDPNAKAMWGRTRSQTFKPKKGKGSFKRHPKHRLGEEFDTPKKEDVDRFLDMLRDDGWDIESVDEYETFFDGAKQIHIQVIDRKVFPVGNLEGLSDSEKIAAHRRFIEAGHEREVWARADDLFELSDEFDPNNMYHITSSSSFGGTSKTGIDCSGRVTAGIDLRPYYISDEVVDLGGDDSVTESNKKRKQNALKQVAARHRKTDVKGAKGWFVNLNAGDVEKNVQHFNDVSSAQPSAGASAPSGVGESLSEAAEKHDSLNPKLWDESGQLKPEVHDKIMEIVKEFTGGLEEDGIRFKVDDVVIVGSNCSYNYSDKSDLDIHIRMDTDSLECPDDLYPLLYSAYRSLFNNKFNIDFYGIPVEIYVETSDTEQMDDETIDELEDMDEARKQSALKSNGIYSVMNNEWIKEPVMDDISDVDEEAFEAEFNKWKERYDEVVSGVDFFGHEMPVDGMVEALTKKSLYVYGGPIKRFGRRVVDYAELETRAVSMKQAINNLLFKAAEYIGYDRSSGAQVEIDEDSIEKVGDYDDYDLSVPRMVCPKCGKTLLNDSGECPLCDLGDESVLDESVDASKIEDIEDFIEDIYDLRRESIATEGEYGIGNLVFKEFRNLGYLDNLKELKNLLKSVYLSLEGLDEHLSKGELAKKVPNITEDDVRSWIGDEQGWDMTIDPDTLKKADFNDLPSGWIVTQDFGLDNLFNTKDYEGMTDFIRSALLKYGDKYYIGTYKMKFGRHRGEIAIDVNRIIDDTVEAIKDGIKNRQESIYRFDEYLFLTHNLISRRDGNKKPYPLTEDELKDYGLDGSIVEKPMTNCMNIELIDGIRHTNIPSVIKKK